MKRSTQEIQVAVVAMTLTVAAVGTFFYVAVAGTELPQVLRWFFAGAAVLLLVCAVPVVVLSVAVMADARRARRLASAIPACDKRRGRARDEAVP